MGNVVRSCCHAGTSLRCAVCCTGHSHAPHIFIPLHCRPAPLSFYIPPAIRPRSSRGLSGTIPGRLNSPRSVANRPVGSCSVCVPQARAYGLRHCYGASSQSGLQIILCTSAGESSLLLIRSWILCTVAAPVRRFNRTPPLRFSRLYALTKDNLTSIRLVTTPAMDAV